MVHGVQALYAPEALATATCLPPTASNGWEPRCEIAVWREEAAPGNAEWWGIWSRIPQPSLWRPQRCECFLESQLGTTKWRRWQQVDKRKQPAPADSIEPPRSIAVRSRQSSSASVGETNEEPTISSRRDCTTASARGRGTRRSTSATSITSTGGTDASSNVGSNASDGPHSSAAVAHSCSLRDGVA